MCSLGFETSVHVAGNKFWLKWKSHRTANSFKRFSKNDKKPLCISYIDYILCELELGEHVSWFKQDLQSLVRFYGLKYAAASCIFFHNLNIILKSSADKMEALKLHSGKKIGVPRKNPRPVNETCNPRQLHYLCLHRLKI